MNYHPQSLFVYDTHSLFDRFHACFQSYLLLSTCHNFFKNFLLQQEFILFLTTTVFYRIDSNKNIQKLKILMLDPHSKK